MKILAIGDFHGKFPEKLKQKIRKEKPDLILSNGDYMPFSYRKIWFKHCYKSNTELWEIVGKKKVKEWMFKDLKTGGKILKQFNDIAGKIPTISITGNLDRTKWGDAIDSKKSKWKWYDKDFFSPIIKKYRNIKIFDYSYVKFKDHIFIGMPGTSFSGMVKSKNYKKMRRRLDKLFKRFIKNKIIFVFHNVPYKTKLSKINSKDSPKDVQGIDKGSKLVRRIIEKYKPVLVVCGHMHENQGKCKIGKTIIVNPGAARDEKAAIIEFDEKSKRVKDIKFIR